MNKKSSEGKRSVITSDKYLSESGIKGGNVLGEHISLESFIVGIPFFIIGLIALTGMFFNLGFQTNSAIIIGSILITSIGLLLFLGGYYTYKTKHNTK